MVVSVLICQYGHDFVLVERSDQLDTGKSSIVDRDYFGLIGEFAGREEVLDRFCFVLLGD